MTTTATGYLVEATLADDSLTIRGTNKAGRFALFGPDPRESATIPLTEIAEARHKAPKGPLGFVNGILEIQTREGQKYALNYRAKKQAEFGAFAEQVVAAVTAARSA